MATGSASVHRDLHDDEYGACYRCCHPKDDVEQLKMDSEL